MFLLRSLASIHIRKSLFFLTAMTIEDTQSVGSYTTAMIFYLTMSSSFYFSRSCNAYGTRLDA